MHSEPERAEALSALIRALDERAWRGASSDPRVLADVAQIREILLRCASPTELVTRSDMTALGRMVRRRQTPEAHSRAVAGAARLAAGLIGGVVARGSRRHEQRVRAVV